MNKLTSYLFIAVLGIMISCASSNPASLPYEGDEVIDNGYTTTSKRNSTSSSETLEFKNEVGSLDNYLARVPGVIVQGSGPSANIKIRGLTRSFNGTSAPLFVVNGSRVGTSFATVASMCNAQDIKRVTVLKDPNDTAIYGTSGSNGVIVIQLKDSKR